MVKFAHLFQKQIMTKNRKVVVLFTILILPLNILALIISDKVVESTITQAMTAEQAVINLYMTELDKKMKEVNNLLFYYASSDPNCIEMGRQGEDLYQYNSSKMKFFSTLKHMDSISDTADGYFYCMNKKDEILIYGSSSENQDVHRFLDEQMEPTSKARGLKSMGWHLFAGEEAQYLVYFFGDHQFAYGTWLNLNKVLEQLVKEIHYQDAELFFADKVEVPSRKESIHLKAMGKKIDLHLYLSQDEILDGIDFYVKFIKGFAMIYFFLVPILYLFIKWMLLNPLHQYQIEVYEAELEKQKMELRNLQLQIRPHFLLNTFNLIFTLTQQGATEPIQKIIMYLSDYFRYIFRNEKELCLFRKELDLIKGYIDIISIRYNGQIHFDDDIDPEIFFIRTPPLLIHNFIENAVKHGKRDGVTLHIFIRAEYEDGQVVISILDDGNGFEASDLLYTQDILRGSVVPQHKNSHMGIYNSYKRLKYFYGKDAMIEVESEKNVMTLFTIRFTYNLEVDDETFDRE